MNKIPDEVMQRFTKNTIDTYGAIVELLMLELAKRVPDWEPPQEMTELTEQLARGGLEVINALLAKEPRND